MQLLQNKQPLKNNCYKKEESKKEYAKNPPKK